MQFRKLYVSSLLFLTSIIICSNSTQSHAEDNNCADIVYIMCNVSGINQGDAHLLKFANDSTYVIDAGYDEQFTLCLKKYNVRKIDKLFISHAHKDHYGGIEDAIKAGIEINTVYFNIPDKDACDSEKPWGCEYEHIIKTIQFIKSHTIPVESMKAGDTFTPQENTVLTVLSVYDGSNSPIGRTDINDASAIMKLTYGDVKILFTGDLNKRLSEYLVEAKYDMKADILKVPHHGTEGVATNAFFDAVAPKRALIPAPRTLWLSDRSKRIRDYFSSKNIPVAVSGIDNDVITTLSKNHYDVIKITADAGDDQQVCVGDQGTAEVILDASKSSISYGTINSFIWAEDGNPIASGITPVVSLDQGVHLITLTIKSDCGFTATDMVKIDVRKESTDQTFDKKFNKKSIEVLELCSEQYESCLESCDNEFCEGSCLKNLSTCEADLPVELRPSQ